MLIKERNMTVMKTKKYISIRVAFFLQTLCFLLSACTQGELLEQESKDTRISIASAGVTDPVTRSITDNKLAGSTTDPVEIGVWIQSDSERYNAHNMKWSHNGESWKSESSALFQGNGKQQICAIYPYTGNATIETGVTVMAEEQTDYLVAANTEIHNNPVYLTMKHALAKLVLQPTFGEEMTGTGIRLVEVQNMYAYGTLKISDNTWSGLGAKEKTLAMTDNEVLVIPMENCPSFPIVVTMENGQMFKANVSLANIGNALEAGNKYIIKLHIGGNKVKSGAVTTSIYEKITL